MGLRSAADWLLLGADMRVPCDSHQMLWIGADGTVQQCYVTFKLGNLHENRLTDILFTEAHRQAARDTGIATAVATSPMAVTTSGRRTAVSSATSEPIEWPTIAALGAPEAAISAAVQSAIAAMEVSPAPSVRP